MQLPGDALSLGDGIVPGSVRILSRGFDPLELGRKRGGDGAGVRVLEERTYRLGSLAEDLRRMLTAKEVHWTRDFRIVVGFRGDGEVAIVDVLAYLGLYAEQLADRGKGCLGIRGAGRDIQE